MARTSTLVSALGGALLAALAAVGLSAQVAAQDAQPDVQVLERGEELFGALCAQCHGEDGSGMQMALAPAIAGHEAWYVEAQLEKFQKAWRGGHPDDIAGMRMRPMALWLDTGLETDADRKAVAAYVASMPKAYPEPVVEGGDAERGATYYAPCTACHGPQGLGNQPLNAPGLTYSSDWYLVRSIEKFKAGVRGWNPEDVTAQVMRGMAASLPDEQAVKDVVAYIMSLRAQAEQSASGAATPAGKP